MEAKHTILITGATGMIGSLLVGKILKENNFDRIVLLVRDKKRAERHYDGFHKSNYKKLSFVESRIEEINLEKVSVTVDSIIHCACITQSKEMVTHPVETADSIVLGTKNILELAREKKVKSMVYLSSMEVYGKVEDTGKPLKENELGDIDLQIARSCYPMAKRMAEHYCHLYHKEYAVPVKIARLAQTFGEGVRPEDARVYMQFARAAYEGKDIILKTHGTSMGNYCAIDDAIEGIWTILHKGNPGEVYNVVNEANTMSILDMAHLVSEEIAGGKIQVRIEPEDFVKTGYAPDTGLRLSGEKLRKLGWQPHKELAEMYREVINELEKDESGK